MQDSQLKKSSIFYEGGRNKIQQIWSMQKEIKDKLEKGLIHDKCIFLVGDTNVGKTTLLYYLTGMKLKLEENPIKKTKQMKAIEVYQNAIICNTLSTTEIPNVFTMKQGSADVSLIDMPGMNDNRFLSLISNIFTFEQVFQKIDSIKQIHIAFVISQEMFDAQDIKENIREFTEHFNIKNFQSSKNISLIFTKTEDDLEKVKDIFFEYLEAIKEDIQDEDEEDIARFIQILSTLNTQQDLAYCFPGQEPDQQEGEKITAGIMDRDCFIENDKTSLLNSRFIQNIMESSKLKFPAFENNFIDILNQLHRTIEKSLLMAIQLIKCIHKNFVSSLFENQNNFNQFKENFCQTYLKHILPFKNKERNDESFTTEIFMDIISEICQKLTEEQSLYEIDRYLRDALNCQAQEQSSSENKNLKLDFLISFSHKISYIFNKIQKNLRPIEQSNILMEFISNMREFYNWISTSWFDALSKIESLPKISDKLAEISGDLSELKTSLWKQLSDNSAFFEVFSSFSEKQVEEEGCSQEESDGQLEKVVKVVGLTLNELREKYTKPKYLQKVNSSIDAKKSLPTSNISQQKQCQSKVTKIVRRIEQKLLPFKEKIQPYGDAKNLPFKDKQIQMIFFQKKHLRHRIYLESALKNFIDYLNFYLYMVNVEKSRRRKHGKVVEFLNGFIYNICSVLEQYLLYEEQILIYLFMNNLQKAINVMNRGFQKVRISQQFIREKLIPISIGIFQKELKEQRITKEIRQKIIQIITRSYNYLIAEFGQSRSRQKEYETEMEAQLNKITQVQEGLKPAQPINQVRMNYQVLKPIFSLVSQILKKINDFQQKHASTKIYRVYQELFPKKAVAKPKTTPQDSLQNLQNVYRSTPAPQ